MKSCTCMAHESDWIIQRHILRERGIILAGPAPQSLIDPISSNELRQAVMDVLPLWAKPILDDPYQIKNRGYQSYRRSIALPNALYASVWYYNFQTRRGTMGAGNVEYEVDASDRTSLAWEAKLGIGSRA